MMNISVRHPLEENKSSQARPECTSRVSDSTPIRATAISVRSGEGVSSHFLDQRLKYDDVRDKCKEISNSPGNVSDKGGEVEMY